MSKRFRILLGYPCLTCAEVRTALKNLGFTLRTQEGSHEQWVMDIDDSRRKVTVACHNKPFCNKIMKYMIQQSQFTKRQFYDAVEQ